MKDNNINELVGNLVTVVEQMQHVERVNPLIKSEYARICESMALDILHDLVDLDNEPSKNKAIEIQGKCKLMFSTVAKVGLIDLNMQEASMLRHFLNRMIDVANQLGSEEAQKADDGDTTCTNEFVLNQWILTETDCSLDGKPEARRMFFGTEDEAYQTMCERVAKVAHRSSLDIRLEVDKNNYYNKYHVYVDHNEARVSIKKLKKEWHIYMVDGNIDEE